MELSPTRLLPLSWYRSWVLFQSLFFPNQGIERDRRAQAPSNLEEFEVNDLNYEDKLQEDRFLYSNIAFNLAADAGEGSQQCWAGILEASQCTPGWPCAGDVGW